MSQVPMGLVPTLLPMKHQASWQLVADHPWQALGLLLLLTFWTMFSIMLPAAGRAKLPGCVIGLLHARNSPPGM